MHLGVGMNEILAYLEHALRMYALNVVWAILIFIIGRWAAKAIAAFARKMMQKRKVDEMLGRFIGNVLYALILVAVIIAAVGQLGVETTSLVAIIGAAGLAVGLALQGSLSNFASGVMIIIFRPFKVADYVGVAGEEGLVREVSIFTTTLVTLDNRVVVIPNGSITAGSIINFTAEEKRRIDLVFGISYGDDIKHAKDVMMDVLRSDERILKDPAPKVGVLELADSSVNFAVRPWVKTADYWDVYFATVERMKQRLDAENITIPFPQRDVHTFQQSN